MTTSKLSAYLENDGRIRDAAVGVTCRMLVVEASKWRMAWRRSRAEDEEESPYGNRADADG